MSRTWPPAGHVTMLFNVQSITGCCWERGERRPASFRRFRLNIYQRKIYEILGVHHTSLIESFALVQWWLMAMSTFHDLALVMNFTDSDCLFTWTKPQSHNALLSLVNTGGVTALRRAWLQKRGLLGEISLETRPSMLGGNRGTGGWAAFVFKIKAFPEEHLCDRGFCIRPHSNRWVMRRRCLQNICCGTAKRD